MLSLSREAVSRVLGTDLPPGVGGVSGVTHDSRSVEPGFAFVAVPGFKHDGVRFAADALKRGASLVVAEREFSGAANVAVVPDAREALAALACAVNGDPSSRMSVYGVTGTNGKTTTSYALHGILAGAFGSQCCGLMTTVETVLGAERHPAVRTTPEAPEVQATLREMLDAGVRHVVMEVSSHGIALKRAAGTRFAGALFTNLSRDHLDLHGTMEEYYRAKRELFYWVPEGRPRLANADDPHGHRVSREVEGVQTFGASGGATYKVERVRPGPSGTAFCISHPNGMLEIESPLLGSYNVENVAGAVALALASGVAGQDVRRAVREMGQVPGRFERVDVPGEPGFQVVVDYAHTDVGLEAVLEVARGVVEAPGEGGRVLCVFGAAGERDGAKRPLMGSVAERLADFAVITTDDAYGEDPGKIAREVAAGAGGLEIELDRRAAIRRALSEARPGDVVVVAGKGHEQVQHLPWGDVPFHDATVVKEIAGELAGSRT